MDPPANRDDLIQQFCALTQATPSDGASTLASCNWDLEPAIQTWFASQDQDDSNSDDFDYGAEDAEDDKPRPIPTTTGDPSRSAGTFAGPTSTGAGRTLGSNSRTGPSGSGGATGSAGQGAAGGIRTLRDIGSHAEDEDDDDEKDPSYFAGGEKSGLAVQGSGPGRAQDAIQGILDRARRNLPRPGGDDEPPRPTRFTGRGVTLGGDDAPSEVVVEPPASRAAASRGERVRRTLHLWQDGFSVDSGDLYRYDDPANRQALDLINSGRAPVHLLNVQHGQEVDLEVDVKKETNYVRPKAVYKPFGGQGQRLGSPTTGPSTSATTVAVASPPGTSSTAKAPEATVDESIPTITLQIRLGDGTRLQSRFNTTHSIGDVYDFVDHAQTGQRAYALMTTFPSKELGDREAVLGDLPEFKRGGVVVQKWT